MGLKIYLMKSRNKDNKDIPSFKERTETILEYSENKDKILVKFYHFVTKGVPGEISRLYESVNDRDEDKIRKAFIAKLVTEEPSLVKLNNIITSIAMRKENALEKKWMFDFDCKDKESLDRFLSELKSLDITYIVHNTPNGYAIVTEHGFDTRDLLEKFSDVDITLKRDDMLFVSILKKSDNIKYKHVNYSDYIKDGIFKV